MHFATRSRATPSPRVILWKQPLLVSVLIHAALLWIAMTWWHTRPEKVAPYSQVVEVVVVERAVSASVAARVTKPEPVAHTPTTHRPEPLARPQPIKNVVSPSKSQIQVQQRSQPSSQREPVQVMTVPTEAKAPQEVRQGGHVDKASGSTPEAAHSVKSDQTIDHIKAYQQQLRELIDRYKQYPLMARKGNQQGQVVIEFNIARTGEPGSVKVKQSSGYALLDRAALKAVHAVEVFPEPPAALQENSSFQLSVSFVLE